MNAEHFTRHPFSVDHNTKMTNAKAKASMMIHETRSLTASPPPK